MSQPRKTVGFFLVLMVGSLLLFPLLGRDFFPQVDAGQMRLHVRAPAGTRLERTQEYFSAVEAQIRQIVGAGQVAVILNNIGLPYSGINIALSDTATVGPMDGEILVSLNEQHEATAALIARLRRNCRSFSRICSSFSSRRTSSTKCLISASRRRSTCASRVMTVRPRMRSRPRSRRI